MTKLQEENRKNADVVSTMLNTFGFDYRGFCESMTQEHRTLQQSFTRLCVEWLMTCASENYRYDDRNEASHTVAKQMMDTLKKARLPMI